MEQFSLLAPEILLFTGGLVIFLIDVFVRDRTDSGRGYATLALFTLGAAFVASLFQTYAFFELEVAQKPAAVLHMLEIDLFAALLKAPIILVMILITMAGSTYMNKRTERRGEFWSFFVWVTLAMSVALSASNLIMLYVAIEFLSITSYLLAGFLRDNQRSAEAGLKYFLYGAVASAAMLYGMTFVYGATGTLDLKGIAAQIAANDPSVLAPALLPATMFVMVGLGFKATLAPFFQWAPDTYDGAPTPVTIYLSTASKAIGLAVTARVFVVSMNALLVDWVPIMAGLSILTMTMGNLMALRQQDVKRMLAYSSVAHAGYLLIGITAVAAGTESYMDGINGLLIYLIAYMFTNVGAFLVVMVLEERAGRTDIGAFEGLYRRAPALAVMLTVFLLSLAGIPATAGFWGKFFVFGAAVQRQYFWLAGAGVVNAGIAAWYYVNVVRAMYFGERETDAEPVSIPIGMGAVLVVCTLVVFWIGLYPDPLIEWATTASEQFLSVGS